MDAVALVSPPISLKERYGTLAAAGNTMPSLGLLALAAMARQEKFCPVIIEAASLGLTLEQTAARIMGCGAQVVLLTATTMSIHRQAELARRIKEATPLAFIAIGGPHLTALPEETMSRFPQFDVGVIGEGEETVRELLVSLKEGQELTSIPGLIVRNKLGCQLTGHRPFINELDNLPLPAWDLLAGFPGRFRPTASRVRRLPVASIVTSRGCPWECTFCDRSVFGNKYRMFSADYIWEMIHELYDSYGVREITIEDDTFFLNKKRVQEVCQRLLSRGLKLSWSCMGRANMVDTSLLKLMKEAGCWQINYGIESGHQDILDLVDKKISLATIEAALRATKEAGLEAKGFFILGFPTETRATMEATIRFACQMALTDISISFLTPLPGSALYKTAHLYGKFEDDWEKMNLLNVVFVPHGLSEEELRYYYRKMWRQFYLRPRIIGSYLKRALTSPRLTGELARGTAAFLRMALGRG